ncbi:hypothetical protein [Streptomyces sp. NPDC051286]|uniref:hypothetical protein n=1 Tax=Streptomyces sp. NPDC051286 TaxID=3365647 RepID=UPI0037A7B61F
MAPACRTTARALRSGRRVSAALPGVEDAELRAALLVTTLVSVTIGHQLVGLDALRDTPADHIATLLRPALTSLTEPPQVNDRPSQL